MQTGALPIGLGKGLLCRCPILPQQSSNRRRTPPRPPTASPRASADSVRGPHDGADAGPARPDEKPSSRGRVAWRVALGTATCIGVMTAARTVHGRGKPSRPPPPQPAAAASIAAARRGPAEARRSQQEQEAQEVAAGGAALVAALAAARARFLAAWVSYATIPVVAGLLNWATNSLAVQMIFAPMEYAGLDIYRRPGEPLGLLGWQGIVPAKAEKMAGTMVDLMTSRLLNISQVFGRLDAGQVGELLQPGILEVAGGAAAAISIEGSGRGWARGLYRRLPEGGKAAARGIVAGHGDEIVRRVLGEMQGSIHDVWDVKGQVVGAMTSNKQIIVDLFKRCGRNEFVFIRRSGLYFGFLFGILQMLVWLFWDPWWSLAVGGALVGYATNWLALTMMFSPIEPVKVGPFNVQGAFLKRQQEVSVEFAALLRERVLTAQNIWDEILTGPRRDAFFDILRRQTREELGVAAKTPYGRAAKLALGEAGWTELENTVVEEVAANLPRHLPLAYPYSDEALDLEVTLRDKMRELSSAEFEGVLHPVFQEDELTLIVVGGVLGALAGFLQAAFLF